MLIPIGVDVPFDRRPFLNWLVVFATVFFFGLEIVAVSEGGPEAIDEFILNGYNIKGLFSHIWIHAGFFHIIGNMIFLWVFGNAVCSKIGNVMYLPVYILIGLAAAVTFNIFSGGRALGASGAVNGIVGMYLIFFPLNDITCFYWFYLHIGGTFSLSSYWMILFWFAFDIFGVVSGGQGVAYTAHIGGLFTGIIIAVVLLKLRIVQMENDERSLLQVFGINLEPRHKSPKRKDAAPGGPREEAILRAARDRHQADQEDSYRTDYRHSEPGARFAYQRSHYADDEIETEPVRQKRKSVPAAEAAPTDDGYIRFLCRCGKKLKVPGKYAGKNGKCPRCGSRMRVPG